MPVTRFRLNIEDITSGAYSMKLFYCGNFKEPIKVVKQKQKPRSHF